MKINAPHHSPSSNISALSLSSSECDGSSGMLCSLLGLHQSALTRLVGSECVLVFYLQQFASSEISKREEGEWERLFKQSDRERERLQYVYACWVSTSAFFKWNYWTSVWCVCEHDQITHVLLIPLLLVTVYQTRLNWTCNFAISLQLRTKKEKVTLCFVITCLKFRTCTTHLLCCFS